MCSKSICKIELTDSKKLILCSTETRKLVRDVHAYMLETFPDIEIHWFKKALWKMKVWPPFNIIDGNYCYKNTSSKYDSGVQYARKHIVEKGAVGVLEIVTEGNEEFCHTRLRSI